MRPSLRLRPIRSLARRPVRSLALVGVLGVAATACGVTADTTAATVGERTVSIDDVNAVVDDPAIVGPAVEGVDESRQPGDLARTALMYEIQRVTWIEEAERWGVEPTPEQVADAEVQLDAQLAGAGVQLSDDNRDRAIASSAAQNVLLERFAEIDPTDEDDLRLIYEGAPSRWRSWCLTVVAIPADGADRVESLLDDGVALDEVADRVDDAELLATPDQCFVGSELPPELETAARDADGSQRPAPVETSLGADQGLMYFEVERASSSSFDEAREEVAFVAQNLQGAVEALGALSQLGADAYRAGDPAGPADPGAVRRHHPRLDRRAHALGRGQPPLRLRRRRPLRTARRRVRGRTSAGAAPAGRRDADPAGRVRRGSRSRRSRRWHRRLTCRPA